MVNVGSVMRRVQVFTPGLNNSKRTENCFFVETLDEQDQPDGFNDTVKFYKDGIEVFRLVRCPKVHSRAWVEIADDVDTHP